MPKRPHVDETDPLRVFGCLGEPSVVGLIEEAISRLEPHRVNTVGKLQEIGILKDAAMDVDTPMTVCTFGVAQSGRVHNHARAMAKQTGHALAGTQPLVFVWQVGSFRTPAVNPMVTPEGAPGVSMTTSTVCRRLADLECPRVHTLWIAFGLWSIDEWRLTVLSAPVPLYVEIWGATFKTRADAIQICTETTRQSCETTIRLNVCRVEDPDGSVALEAMELDRVRVTNQDADRPSETDMRAMYNQVARMTPEHAQLLYINTAYLMELLDDRRHSCKSTNNASIQLPGTCPKQHDPTSSRT